MKKHQMDRHYGAEADFGAKVTGVFRDCLSRQVSEGVYIKRSVEWEVRVAPTRLVESED